MNRYYGLGEYARQGAGSSSSPDWLVALNARSDALNRQYGLGEYAAKRDTGERRRSDATQPEERRSREQVRRQSRAARRDGPRWSPRA